VHGRVREHHFIRDEVAVLLAHALDQRGHGERRLIVLEQAQEVDDLGRDRATAALVCALLRHQRIEAATAVVTQPAADRLGRNAPTQRARDVVLALSLVTQQLVQAAMLRWQVRDVGDHAVAEQRDGLAQRVQITARVTDAEVLGIVWHA
jgi:hypothetical protein